ncbi:prolyl oligopeptidase family serine peptidase [Luteibacter anthropi]|uniref:alpha/beta hydrolase family protein n=1 Tax=Luteibacter anthropi TaxID=564369 RepID=UPI002032AB24|nr:prolyl oligopeptidase family serine peptidase [Luteibacter anthropi]URX62594.1 prolyl oligopeptidase family serine peptidase [Luteibacter anthropi]
MSPPLTAAQAVAAGTDFTELAAASGVLVYGRFDPADGTTRLWMHRDGHTACLTPDGYSVRSRVYEYGGGSFCLGDGAAFFVNEKDQQVYRQSLDGSPPAPFGGMDDARYGDLVYDEVHARILAVEEHPEGGRFPVHRLVAIHAQGKRRVLAEGADFYASPRAHSHALAWIEWDRPHQPWTRTRLMKASLDQQGQVSRPATVVAEGDESIQQPLFDNDGAPMALTDRDGWWRPWRFSDDAMDMPLRSPLADHAGAPWQMGTRTWVVLPDGCHAVCWFDRGFGRLSLLEGDAWHDLASDYTRFRALAVDGNHLYAIAASPTRPSTVISIDLHTRDLIVIAGGESPLAESYIALPQPITWPVHVGARLARDRSCECVDGVRDNRSRARRAPTEANEASHATTAHGFLYLPTSETPPPLIVFIHGGPTSATHPVFDPRIQFWTGHGFAVADINYRGSTGYGRAYRDALRGAWGVADVEDACALVPWLIAQGLIDPSAAFIRGGSAGGYTALCALAFRDVFRGGGSLYGVSDPIALAKDTHKFEADYMDWLIGDPDADEAIYRERTPLLHVDGIRVPVIFFQGGRDAVVVPAQTEAMVDALRHRGILCEYHAYPEERHGFRQATNLAHALDHEHAFYQNLL